MLEKQRRQNVKHEKEKKKPREKQFIHKKRLNVFFSSDGQNNVILTH